MDENPRTCASRCNKNAREPAAGKGPRGVIGAHRPGCGSRGVWVCCPTTSMDGPALHGATPALTDRRLDAGVASQQVEERSGRRWLRDPGLVVLAVLPLVLLTVDSDWIFSGPHRDAWIYYGYFRNAVFYLRQFQEVYYSSRLAVILPGFLLHHLLPPLMANLVLHLALYWAAVLSFYLVVKKTFGVRVALLTGLALGCHPYLLKRSRLELCRRLRHRLLPDGAAAGDPRCRIAVLAPSARGRGSHGNGHRLDQPLLWGLSARARRSLRRPQPAAGRRVPLLAGALWAGLGAVGLFLLFGCFTWGLGEDFLYLRSSLSFVAGAVGAPNIFRDGTYRWLRDAVWLVFPTVALLGSVIAPRARSARPLSATESPASLVSGPSFSSSLW